MKIDIPTKEQRTAANPKASVWVTANAGSGKTHVLVDRVIRLMLDDAEPETILCLTFTKAAAAEMQSRLFLRLGEWTLAPDEDLRAALDALGLTSPNAKLLARARQLFTRALETPGGLKIQTVHAFAEKLLRLFPVEAGITPDFEVIEDRQSTDLLAQARSHVLMVAQTQAGSDEALALAQVEPYCSETTFDELLGSLIAKREAITELDIIGVEAIRRYYYEAVGLDPDKTLGDLALKAVKVGGSDYELFIERLLKIKEHRGYQAGACLQSTVKAPDVSAKLAALRLFACTGKNEPRADSSMLPKAAGDDNPDLRDYLLATRDRAFENLQKHDLALRAEASAGLLYLAVAAHRHYATVKKHKGLHDFSDLIGLAAGLLGSRHATEWVLYKLDRGLKHILVDEAQDTSPSQWRIVQSLAQEFFAGLGASEGPSRTLFVVGDRKQSIYGFQGADVQSFEAVRSDFAAHIAAAGQDFPDISLQLSYRSVQTVLDFVDTVFPAKALAKLGFSRAMGDDNSGHTANRKDKGLVQVWPVIEPTGDKADPDPNGPVDQEPESSHRKRLARVLATTIKGWLGRRVLSGSDRLVQAGDIMVLFRRRSPLFNYLIAELRQADVPVAGADRLSLRDSLAVMDLVMMAQCLLLPDDDHALACVLKSPLVPAPLNDDGLLALARDRGTQALWQRLASSSLSDASRNFAFLAELQATRHQSGPHGFFVRLLAQARKAMVRRLGPEALDATDAFVDLALEYEVQQQPSLSGFITWFLADDTIIKREMDQAAGLVRLMTVHGSKGLEAPIVILADAADEPSRKGFTLLPAPKHHSHSGLPLWAMGDLTRNSIVESWKADAERLADEEHARMLYVAMTRARDELFICGSSSAKKIPEDSWYATISAALAEQDKLGIGELVQLEDIEKPVMHYGIAFQWRAAVDANNDQPDNLPDWLSAADTSETVARHSGEYPDLTVRDIDKALAGHGNDKRVRMLLAPDCDSDVNWAFRSEDGASETGTMHRLAVADGMVVALLCLPDETQPPPDLAPVLRVLSEAYPDRIVMAGLLFMQSATLNWFDLKNLPPLTPT
jgi:ATP-dependent helicase/nuclease subunit A